MKQKTFITALLLALTVAGVATVANAQERGDQENRGFGRPGPQNGVEMRGEKNGWAKMGSTTPAMRGEKRGWENGSSTLMRRGEGRFASTTKMGRFEMNASSTRFVGKVSNLTSSSFTISSMMRPNATSSVPTLTIDLTASTTIRTGSTTASVSDLANDKVVMVFGSLDKNTNTVTATQINILPARPVQGDEDHASSTPKGFFGGMKQGIGHIFNKMFGWMHF